MLINYPTIHHPNSHPIYSLSKSLPCLLPILLKFLLTFFVNRTFKKKNVFKTILKETGLKLTCDLLF